MPTSSKTQNPVFFATPADFRAWLEQRHETASELVVGFYKRHTAKPSLTWPESVDEALSFGWIDGVRRSLGDDSYTIRFTPRKPTSIWSAVNVKRARELIAEGRMRPRGVTAFEARTEAKSRVYSYEQAEQSLGVYEKQLRANKKAWAFFQAQAPWYRRTSTHWVTSAKREDTRVRRLVSLIEACANGRPIKPLAGAKVKR